MRKFLGEKYNKFSLRKLTVGVCSMTIGSFFLVSTVNGESNIIKAADNAVVYYKYVGENNLTDKEKELIKKEVPSVVSSTEETYYLVFKPNKSTQLNKLPNTGLNYGVGSILLGGMLGLLVVVVVKGKNKSRKILSILLVTSMGATALELPVRAMEDLQLSVYNMDYNLKVGDKLPEISAIPGYSFVGFIKNETKKLKEEAKENVNSQQNNKKQPQLKEITDVNVTDKKQENKASLDNTDKKVIENTNKKEEKVVHGVNTVNPQDEVLAGTLTRPELLYTDTPVETPVQYNQIIENNNQLPEGTTRIKQHGKLGKKIDVVRIFTVEGKEISRELVSTNTISPVSEIIEKGTKKVESTAVAKGEKLVKPAVEVKPEYTGVQAGAIVEPEKVDSPKEYTGVQAGAIVEPEKVEPLKEYTGVQAGAIVEPEKVEPPKEYTGVQAGAIVEPEKVEPPKEYTGVQAGAIVEPEKVEPQYGGVTSGALVEPEKVESPKEYTGVQAGAIVEPEKVEPPKEYTGVQAGAIVEPEKAEAPKEYTGVQAGAIVEPEKVEPPKEYTGVQAGAIVEPEKVEPPKEYTGVQAGAIVEPEKVEPPKEYTGKIEQPSTGETKPGNEANPTNGESERPKDEIKEEKQVDKKLELRNISNVELYKFEENKYRHVTSVDSTLDNSSKYFMKVKSENFKDIMLPVTKIESTTKNNKEVYKIVAHAENLIQHENNVISNDYTYYLPKTQQSETGVYTSFKNLVDAMNSNPYGEFRLGATMDAREVELSDGQESYVKNEFHGKLVGTNNEKYYAIYNLKKPLFAVLNGATVENLSLKDANISAKYNAATIAKEANNNTRIENVHADGAIAGEHEIGGLVSQVNNSTISNSSYTGRITNTYNTVASYQIGGLVGKLSGSRGLIDKSFASIDLASNATKGDQSIGGIVGAVEDSALISNSYAEGNLNNVQRFANVGGVVGNLWDPVGGLEKSGQLSNVLSDVNVTNGNAITGKDFTDMKANHVYSNKNNKVVNVVQEDDEILTKDSDVQRGEVLEDAQIKEKKAAFVSKNTIKTEDFNFSSRYVTDYKNLENAVSSKEKVYKNIEKLLPFYNRETIVKYGNLIESSSNLYNKELLSVVPLKDNEVISDINKYKSSINKLLLYYADNTSEKLNVNYQSDFSNVAEYRIDGTNLIYTPNTLLRNYNNILDEVLPALNSVQYKSEAIRKALDVSNDVSLTELYLEEQFDTTKNNLKDSLTKLLTADAAIAENNNKVIDNYVIEKIKNNKEALLLGLTYLERWYNFKYGDTKAKDLVMYHLDFFGKSNSSALDNVIELGKSGYNNLLAKNNVITYNVLLAKNYKTNNLFDALEKYRKAFVPDKTNNEWFKEQTKAYIVEEKSTIKEVNDKQSIAGSPYSIGVYDRLTSQSWKYPSMVLPLLTLPEKSVFMIANISTIGFGAYDRYRSKEHPAGTNLNDYVETKAKEAAARFRDHYDYWYKILDDKNKSKLYRSVLVYDAFRFGTDEKVDKDTYQANFETNHPAIKHFFGPAGNNVVHNSNGAYATGDAFYYMAYRMLDKDGAVTYTHEMTHNSDREIYLGGYGRRNGLGPEFYAKGLLQAPDHPHDPTITINSILKYDKSEESTRLQVKDPTERFKNAEDLQKYMHNMFDVIYMLEYLEGNAVVKLGVDKKNEMLRKIENKFKTDPDGSNVYATNVVRYLTGEELNKLNSFDSLIENDIITRRGYIDQGEYERNGYHTIKLFSPIYSALSNNEGTPGDLMGRRMAFELLAAKGFKDGMVPYISNQYAEEAKAKGKVIRSYGKEVGNVTDKLVLDKVFNNRYSSWVDFKKAMYEERKSKFNRLTTISIINPNSSFGRQETVRINNINRLERMIEEAVQADADNYTSILYPNTNSRVHKLKQAIFKAYLDKTDDFRTSIFGEQ